MKNKLNIGGIAFLLFLFSSHAWAQTYTTNIDGVILKNVECFYSDIFLNVSNRTNKKVSGTLMVTIFDGDGDPIDNGKRGFSVGPVSGDRLSISVGCDKAKKYVFRIY